MAEKKSIVVIGGGSGTFTVVLSGLKRYSKDVTPTAIASVADSGGSTGKLRDAFGYLPVGDLRMALASLADENDEHQRLLRELFLYRFNKGVGLSGHNLGNLILVALRDMLGSEDRAIAVAVTMLRAHGNVIPVTLDHIDLVAEYDDGVVLKGETEIDEPPEHRDGHRIARLSVTPEGDVSERARAALEGADMIVLGPGDLYTSILATCVVHGVAEMIARSNAKLVYVASLMTKFGQTTGMGIADHVAELERYLTRRPDTLIINTTAPHPELIRRYEEEREYPMEDDLKHEPEMEVIREDLLLDGFVRKKDGDALKRSFIRHDPDKIARVLMRLI